MIDIYILTAKAEIMNMPTRKTHIMAIRYLFVYNEATASKEVRKMVLDAQEVRCIDPFR